MGNSPSQGGIDDHIKSESRLREEQVVQRNAQSNQRNEEENRMKTMENKVENSSKATSSIQLISKNKVHPAECSPSNANNFHESLSQQKSSSPPNIRSVGVESVNKLPFSDMKREFFNSADSVPWADSLIIANPLPVEECSIFSLDSLEKSEAIKSEDSVVFPDTLESIPLIGNPKRNHSNGNVQIPADTITGSCEKEDVGRNHPASTETGLKLASPSPFTASAETKDTDSEISCSFTSDSLARQTSISRTDSLLVNTEQFFTLKETPITDDIPVYTENDDVVSPVQTQSPLNVSDSKENISFLSITKTDQLTNTQISQKEEKEAAINVTRDADIQTNTKMCSNTTNGDSLPTALSIKGKLSIESYATDKDCIFIKPLAEYAEKYRDIPCENLTTAGENNILDSKHILSEIDLRDSPNIFSDVTENTENLNSTNETKIFPGSENIMSPIKIIPNSSEAKMEIEFQEPGCNVLHLDSKDTESFEAPFDVLTSLNTSDCKTDWQKTEKLSEVQEFNLFSTPSPFEKTSESATAATGFPIKLQLIDDSESVLQFACKNNQNDGNENGSMQDIVNRPQSTCSLLSDNDDKILRKLNLSDRNDCESKMSGNIEIRDDTDAEESSGVYSDLDKDFGINTQNTYQQNISNPEEKYTEEQNLFEIKSDNDCTISDIESPTFVDKIDHFDEESFQTRLKAESISTGILRIDEMTAVTNIDEINPNESFRVEGAEVIPTEINKNAIVPTEESFHETIPTQVLRIDEIIPQEVLRIDETISNESLCIEETLPSENLVTDDNSANVNLLIVKDTHRENLSIHENIPEENSYIHDNHNENSYSPEYILNDNYRVDRNIPHNDLSIKENISSKDLRTEENMFNNDLRIEENISNTHLRIEENISNKELRIEENISNTDLLIEENISNTDLLIEENISNADLLIEENVSNDNLLNEENIFNDDLLIVEKIPNDNPEINKTIQNNNPNVSKNISEEILHIEETIPTEILHIDKTICAGVAHVDEAISSEIADTKMKPEERTIESGDKKSKNEITLTEVSSKGIEDTSPGKANKSNPTFATQIGNENSENLVNDFLKNESFFSENKKIISKQENLDSVRTDNVSHNKAENFAMDFVFQNTEVCDMTNAPHKQDQGEVASMLRECQNTNYLKCENIVNSEIVVSEIQEVTKNHSTEVTDEIVKVAKVSTNNDKNETFGDLANQKVDKDKIDCESKPELEIKEKEPEKTSFSEKDNAKPKGKAIVSKPVANKRIPFSRKLIKPTLKSDDALGEVEIFVGPKKLSLAETTGEQPIPESHLQSRENSESRKNSATLEENTIKSPISVINPQNENYNISNVNGIIDKSELETKDLPLDKKSDDKYQSKVLNPFESTSFVPTSIDKNVNPSVSIKKTPAIGAENLELNLERMKNFCKEIEAEMKSEISAPLTTEVKPKTLCSDMRKITGETKASTPYMDIPLKNKDLKLHQERHEFESNERLCEDRSPSIPMQIFGNRTLTMSPKSGRSWIPDSCQHPAASALEKELIRNKFAKKSILHPAKPTASLAVNTLGSQSQQQGCANSGGQTRDRIMSPSLSNNIYIGMNGIDAEALNALAAQEEQYLEQLQEKENLINELQQNLEQVKHKAEEENFNRVLAEYEKTLSLYVQQIEELKLQIEHADEEKLSLIKERDQAIEDLRNVESAFSDVHRKYERAKALLENMKKNEEILVRRDQDMMMKVQNRDRKLDTMKDKVQENMEKMHQDYEVKLKDAEADNARLRAQFRKMEMKLSTLENDVEQKAKENAQLSALCDELINGEVIN